ncbi:hypothetical protein GPECTOR_1393g607 [Gonium pectorale]|uniref:Uncharacterized protein n=1 Tax=Gonium pectorale TaxID=33097 RepID=A0A150FTJ5_GONPE|nr:hypothetical protein GPECTOR_1393g607 [Gonium pectorale]|eukprot:KXZ40906.1 hypothetical protein GPECTOR_1393g607 [Gonium pectorale]
MADENVETATLTGDVTVRYEDWAGLTVPVVLRRNFTIAGTSARPPTLDMGFVKGKVQLAPGTTLTLRRLVLTNSRSGSINQAPGLDLLVPLRPNDSAVIRGEQSYLLWSACFPLELAV